MVPIESSPRSVPMSFEKSIFFPGTLNIQNLKKLRLTVDQLEMRLRNQGISNIEDVKTATIEPNGLLGYELQEDAKPLTKGEFKKLMNVYFSEVPTEEANSKEKSHKPDIFQEIEGTQQNPKFLQ
jgi:uncharacterized membrane protein YcaP (DUF421 family)